MPAATRVDPPADEYAFLDRDDLMVTTISAMFLDDGTVQMNPHTGLNSFNGCAQADVALLKMMLIDSYETYGMYRRMYTEVPPPNVPDAFRAASQTLLDFHAELVREYGAKHARPAALVERMYWACHWSHRKQHPRICYREEEAHRTFEQALAAREATYGEDHPLTRASLLRVGVVRLAEGKVDQARTLLTRASAGEIDTPSKANAAAILGVLALQAGETDEGLALLARVDAGSDRIYGDDHWTRRQMLQLYASALQAGRRYPEALRVLRRFIASHPAPQPGSPPQTWPGYAELLAAAGEHAEAIAEYERRIEEAIVLEQTGANDLARQKGRDTRLADLRARAELRRLTGDLRGMEAREEIGALQHHFLPDLGRNVGHGSGGVERLPRGLAGGSIHDVPGATELLAIKVDPVDARDRKPVALKSGQGVELVRKTSLLEEPHARIVAGDKRQVLRATL